MPSPTEQAPVVILIHGAGLNGASWNPVRRHIDSRIKLVTPDLPGHGARIAERFTLQGAIDTVAQAAREADGAPVVVGGDSLGGYTATASASAIPPDQLKGLVLSGCTANLYGFRVLMPFRVKKLMSILMTRLMNQRQIDRAMMKNLSALGIGQGDIEVMMAAGLNPGVFPDAVDALQEIDFKGMVAATTQPILFVNGSKDKVFVSQEADFVAAAHAPQRYSFDGTEHGVSLLRSEEFAGLVNRFAAPLLGLATA
jgi:pimeloyl-ACP methyl ester carboxylesterase